MRFAGRPSIALAVGGGAAALTILTALALPAAQAAPGTALTPGAAGRAAAAAAIRAARAGHLAGSGTVRPAQSVPAPDSHAARVIGGPLMAGQGIVVNQPAQAARPLPQVPALAWVIANAQTGQVLAAKDPHGEFGPASTLKVLTAVTLIPLLNPNAMVTTSKLAAEQQPNIAGLIAGRAYQVSALFKALLLISANDAAVSLTQATGSFARGMALINAEARHLQAYDVVAKMPNGLPAPGQVTSAYDEALIARQALALPAFMHYDETLATNFEVKPHHWETLLNQNYLLTQYRGGIGGKIGWTVSSEATYVGMARRNGVTLIATVLHCTPLQEITSAEQLLNWGFAMNGRVTPVGVLVPPLATVMAVHNPVRPKALALSSPQPGPAVPGYVVVAGGVAAAGLGLGGLFLTRRYLTARRHRTQLTATARAAMRAPGHGCAPRRLTLAGLASWS